MKIDVVLLQSQINVLSGLLSSIATPEKSTEHELALSGVLNLLEAILMEELKEISKKKFLNSSNFKGEEDGNS